MDEETKELVARLQRERDEAIHEAIDLQEFVARLIASKEEAQKNRVASLVA